MTTVSLRFDDEMKKQLDDMCEKIYPESNQAQLKKSRQQIEQGKVIVKTLEELEAMELA